MYHFFIGIDISKNDFVVAKQGDKKSISYPNNKKGFLHFCKDFKQQLPLSLVILETTGGYEIELVSYLQSKNFLVHRANTRKVKSFIRSYGTLAKTDSIDAFGLALYGYDRHSKLEIYKESLLKNLLQCFTLR